MPPRPVLRGVDCLALPVPDLEAALRFYRSLGHELIWRTPTGAGLRLPDSEAELVLQTERPRAETDLTVESVEEAVARFTGAGGRVVVAPFDIPIGRCAVVADPWDNQVVVLSNTRGRFVTDGDGNVTGVEAAPAGGAPAGAPDAPRSTHLLAVYVVMRRAGRVLFMLRAGTGYRDGEYGLPSGRVEVGETVAQAAAREAAEELGVGVAAGDLTLRHVMERRTPTGSWLDCFLEARAWDGEPANAEPSKCGGLAWLEAATPGVSDYVAAALAAIDAGVPFSSYAGD